MTQERLIENIKDALGKVIQETVDYYKKGEKKAAWATVDYDLEHGRIMLVLWPNDNSIDVNWSPACAGYGDLGTLVGSVSTEYFGIDTVVFLLTTLINSFMEE